MLRWLGVFARGDQRFAWTRFGGLRSQCSRKRGTLPPLCQGAGLSRELVLLHHNRGATGAERFWVRGGVEPSAIWEAWRRLEWLQLVAAAHPLIPRAGLGFWID